MTDPTTRLAVLATGCGRGSDADRVAGQLTRLGFEVHVAPLAEVPTVLAALLATGPEGLLVVPDDLVVSDVALAALADRGEGSALLTVPMSGRHPLRVQQHRVLSAGSASHDVTRPTDDSAGALLIAAADSGLAAAAVADLQSHRLAGDPLDLLTVAVVRGGVPLWAVARVGPGGRVADAAEAARVDAELAAIGDDRLLLERANRPVDGFYSTFVLRRLSKPLTATAIRLGVSPNAVSLISLVIGLSAAALFATGGGWQLIAGAVLLQVSLVVDCVDGEVARYTRRFSELGAWLDASTDRVKEYAAYAGLAFGATGDWWAAALGLMLLQTLRHLSDYASSTVRRTRELTARRVALDQRGDGEPALGAALELSSRANALPGAFWAKKAVQLPIGERWLLLSVTAALGGAPLVFPVMLALGLLSLGYATAARVLRGRGRWRVAAPDAASLLIGRLADHGPLAELLGRPRWTSPVTLVGTVLLVVGMATTALLLDVDSTPALAAAAVAVIGAGAAWRRAWTGAFGWAAPALIAAAELAVPLAITIATPAAAAAAFGWAFVVAFHRYDVLYRALAGYDQPAWLRRIGLGGEGRTLLLAAGVVLGAGAGQLAAAAWVAALLLGIVASADWLRTATRRAALQGR